MSLTLTGEQGDALRGQIEIELDAFGDLKLLIERREFETANRMALQLSDDLRLMAEDFGWGEGSGGLIELRSPPDVLERTCTRLRELAASHRVSQEGEWEAARTEEKEDRLIEEACDTVLAGLDWARSQGQDEETAQ
jgi:hypothetical protein